MSKTDQWIEQRRLPLLIALSAAVFACWLWAYLTVPYPAVFGDEFNTYALTRAQADPAYNLADFDWIYKLRGSMLVYTAAYQAVHAREGNPLAMAQLLNALCLAVSLPLVWVVARSLVPATVSLGLVVLYAIMPSHNLGAYFILEPMFYVAFWAVLATTLLALRGDWRWSGAAGLLSGLLCNIKPHGLVTCAWSLALIVASAFLFKSENTGKLRRWSGLWWLVAFGLVQLTLHWTSGGTSTDTVKGEGFYGEVFKKLTQPALFWNLLKSAWGNLTLHFGLYGIMYSLVAGLALAAFFDVLRVRSRIRTFRSEDLFAYALPLLGCALLGMTLAFSSLVNETTRVHGRYWSYIITPLLLSGVYLTLNPLVTRNFLSRALPLTVMLIACWFGIWHVPGGLQIAANDCPEIYWAYLGIWHPEWYRTVVMGFVVSGILAGAWFAIRPRSGLMAALVLLLVINCSADYFGVNTIRQNSLGNGVQNRMGLVLQSYHGELINKSILIVAPGSFMAGGAMFGLSRIPIILERPSGTALTANDVSANITIVGTITTFELPGDFVRTWSESDYAVYLRRKTPPANKP